LLSESRVKRLEDYYYSNNNKVSWNDKIPVDFEKFYRLFGLFIHPATGLPVVRLADYQYETARLFFEHKRLLEVKSNKVGETSKWSVIDFQLALFPTSNPLSTRGYDTLVIAQTKDHAKQHLHDLRKAIIDSPAYSKYLINKPDEIAIEGKDLNKVLRDEQSKTSVIYIQNPEKPTRPSRIIALGIENYGAILSWKRVKHIHMSDITASDSDFTRGIDAAMTRLANTNGTCIIETVPGMPEGFVYQTAQHFNPETHKPGDFWVVKVTAEQAVKAGVINQEFLESERRNKGTAFGQFYECIFGFQQGNVFKLEDIEACIAAYDLEGYKTLDCKLFVDPAFGLLEQNSKFAWLVLALLDGKVRVYHAKQFTGMSYNESMQELDFLLSKFNFVRIGIDAANPVFIRGAKERIGENPNYDQLEEKESEGWWKVKPMSFGQKEGQEYLQAIQSLVSGHYLEIHPAFEELILQMKMAVTDDKGKLDKTMNSMDLFDCLRMGAATYRVENQ